MTMVNWLRKIFGISFDQPAANTPQNEEQPASLSDKESEPYCSMGELVTRKVDGIYPDLVKTLLTSPKYNFLTGRILFHGCTDKCPGVDIKNSRLTGSYKWLSENPEYAISYAYDKGGEHKGSPLLFECRLSVDTVAVFAEQNALHKCGDWNNPESKFPLAFERHAKAAFGTDDYFIFQNDCGELNNEVLVPNPLTLLKICRVHDLPSNLDEARKFVQSLSES